MFSPKGSYTRLPILAALTVEARDIRIDAWGTHHIRSFNSNVLANVKQFLVTLDDSETLAELSSCGTPQEIKILIVLTSDERFGVMLGYVRLKDFNAGCLSHRR